MRTASLNRTRIPTIAGLASLVVLGLPTSGSTQETGTVRGTVTRQDDQSRLRGVTVSVQGTNIAAITSADGSYILLRVPAGPQTILFRWLGFRPASMAATVTAGGTLTVDAALEAHPIALEEVVISASRTPERVVEAPAAVSIADIPQVRSAAITGQLPRAIANVPGVDLVQSGISDFNLNTRGFNSSLNRRVLVLQDGRDLSIAFLGAQEWNANPPPEDAARVEMVRGPGSALYGANAFSGVLSISTPPARAIRGTRVSLTGGELSSFKGDFRHAGVFSEGRLGYKVSGGYSTSDTWSRSRTRTDGTDIVREYDPATDAVIPAESRMEQVPLSGQTRDAMGLVSGDRDPIVNIHGTGRLDYYGGNSITTFEAGATQVENELFVTGIGRVQVQKALRPWGRVTWAHPNYNVMAWYSGRNSRDPQLSLLSGGGLEEKSHLYHVEGQYNRDLLQDRARIVLGGSFRLSKVNTEGTLMAPADDDRSDQYYSAYAQVEYDIIPQLRAVAATRFDDSDLFDRQFSPKGALVFSPNEDHSIRFTFNRAFQTPNHSEFFLRAAVAAPSASPRTLERGIEQLFQQMNATGIGAGLGLPNNLPWNFDSLTQALALGNSTLEVEKVTGWELGYKGNFAGRGFVTIDGYINELKNFVTDLLPAILHPGGNPLFTQYSLGDQNTNIPQNLNDLEARVNALAGAGMIPPATAATILGTIAVLRPGYNSLAASAGPLLATMGGSRTLVLSYANAGRVIERGVEFGAGYYLTNALKVEGSYTFFDFTKKDAIAGDSLLPNTPKHKGNITVSYSGPEGLDLSATARLTDSYPWAAGVYVGPIPASQMIDINAGYNVNNYVRLHAVATNVLDQQRYMIYGGSVLGRRVLGGITATF